MPQRAGKTRSIPTVYPEAPERINPLDDLLLETTVSTPLVPAFKDRERGIYLYQHNCLEVLDAIAAKHPDGVFDMIFADPPYFLSNGGITCQAGKMVKVDKGGWDKSRGAELNHASNLEWLERCQRVLKPNGTIWVSGTHHVIFSVGFAMQQLGFKILNDITWEKPNPPPNLSCRYFTHSTETVIWAAKNLRSKHYFNYALMRQISGGKQMKSVWRMTAPGKAEKLLGKHPTQKPLALVERCILAASRPDELILDPFMGSGTTMVAAWRTGRRACGVEAEADFFGLTLARLEQQETVSLLNELTVHRNILILSKNDLDQSSNLMDRSPAMSETGPLPIASIFHETKFVFLSCARCSDSSVVHSAIDVSVTEAWENAPEIKKRLTTHIVRCETEIVRVKKLGTSASASLNPVDGPADEPPAG